MGNASYWQAKRKLKQRCTTKERVQLYCRYLHWNCFFPLLCKLTLGLYVFDYLNIYCVNQSRENAFMIDDLWSNCWEITKNGFFLSLSPNFMNWGSQTLDQKSLLTRTVQEIVIKSKVFTQIVVRAHSAAAANWALLEYCKLFAWVAQSRRACCKCF